MRRTVTKHQWIRALSKGTIGIVNKRTTHDLIAPTEVGILSMDTYFPKSSVRLSDLEEYDGVAAGKYTIGLGQKAMSFTGDREDINSISLSVLQQLLNKNQSKIKMKDIKRLEVGTETVVDKSKSVKTVLMDLFPKEAHNGDIEGIDTTNACYGGTNALFNNAHYLESSYADENALAVTVAGDIAVYSPGPARPTGGAASVALLLGKRTNSQQKALPMVLESGVRGSYMENAWDFYKPNLESEYPVVDGHLSNECYLRALDNCYYRYKESFEKKYPGEKFSIAKELDYCLFHCPYAKLVQKSWARLYYLDYRLNPELYGSEADELRQWENVDPADTYTDRDLMKATVKASKASYESKVVPSLLLSTELGNSYTASLYTCLNSLIMNESNTLRNVKNLDDKKRIGMFSYGSGLAATMFSLLVTDGNAFADGFLQCDIRERLDQRQFLTPEEFTQTLTLREQSHQATPYQPITETSTLFPGTFYLDKIDNLSRRTYLQK